MLRSRASAPAFRQVASGLLAGAVVSIVTVGCGHAVVPAPPDCDRAVTITSQADVTAIASCTSVRALSVKTGAPVDLSKLTALAAITGDLRVGPTVAVDELSLPLLRTVGGTMHLSANGVMHGVFLPKLERAGRVEVTGNVELATLSLPKLSETGAIVVNDCAELEVVDVASLVAVAGELVVADTPKLDVIDAPNLQRIHTLRIEAAPKLPAELVDRLTAAQSGR